MSRLLKEAKDAGSATAAREAWALLTSGKLDHSITQDPRYTAMCGFAALRQVPPLLVEARTYFESSFAMRYSPDVQFVRVWYHTESHEGMGDQFTARILKLVSEARNYPESVRTEFVSKRASFLYNLARENMTFEPERSVQRLQEALCLHAQAYRSMAMDSDPAMARCSNYLRNTAFYLFQQLNRSGRIDDIIATTGKVASYARVALDPLEEPLTSSLLLFVQHSVSRADRQRWASKLMDLSQSLGSAELWIDSKAKKRVDDAIVAAAKHLRTTATAT